MKFSNIFSIVYPSLCIAFPAPSQLNPPPPPHFSILAPVPSHSYLLSDYPKKLKSRAEY